MLVSALMLFMLLVMILLFSVLTSISYTIALDIPFGEVLKFTTAVLHNTDVVGKW